MFIHGHCRETRTQGFDAVNVGHVWADNHYLVAAADELPDQVAAEVPYCAILRRYYENLHCCDGIRMEGGC